MQRDQRAYLWDIKEAAEAIQGFTENKTYEDYTNGLMLRSAVERQFEVIGEALNQLSRIDSELVSLIPDAPQIIAFRNLLIHGYAAVNDLTVWRTIEDSLPDLYDMVGH
jgi:uncharacterized protein with HEPN domain